MQSPAFTKCLEADFKPTTPLLTSKFPHLSITYLANPIYYCKLTANP
jgi:hypothetical protein